MVIMKVMVLVQWHSWAQLDRLALTELIEPTPIERSFWGTNKEVFDVDSAIKYTIPLRGRS